MNIALAASPADFKQFEWMYNAGKAFKLRLDDTPVTVEPDDLVGFRKATRGPTAGAYQVVLAKYPQKIYRSIKQEQIEVFIDQFKEYKGIPAAPSKNGARHSYMRKNQLQNDRQESQFYVSPNKPKETEHYDRNDYQWRKVMHTTSVTTKHYGTTRASLKQGDVIGLRYLRKSHGGYIIMPNGERVLIAHDLYEQITNNTDILPRGQQLTGLVNFGELEQTLPKRPAARRIKIPIKPKNRDEQRKTGESETAKHAKRNAPLVTQFDYKDIDADFDFEPEEEEEILNPIDPDEDFIDEDTVNNGEQPSITDLEDEDFEEEEDPEMDFHKDQEVDDDGEEIEDEEAVLAEEGLTLISRDNSKWIIVSIEEQGMSDSLVLYNPDANSLRHYKIHAGEDLRNVKSVTVGEKLEGPALDKIMEKAADLEMTPGKRL
uniref:KTSC and Metallopeptidase-like N-terminal fusion domain-containing protein n=1 Tax=Pseudomonas phage HRDY3 TaxID=3236930 RepID=A0AB39CEF4_9VIRU